VPRCCLHLREPVNNWRRRALAAVQCQHWYRGRGAEYGGNFIARQRADHLPGTFRQRFCQCLLRPPGGALGIVKAQLCRVSGLTVITCQKAIAYRGGGGSERSGHWQQHGDGCRGWFGILLCVRAIRRDLPVWVLHLRSVAWRAAVADDGRARATSCQQCKQHRNCQYPQRESPHGCESQVVKNG